MAMVSGNIKIDLQGVMKTYLQIRPRRDDYTDTLKTIMGLVSTKNHYPSYLIYQEGSDDTRIPLIVIELSGITIEEAYEEVKNLVNENCKFSSVRITLPYSYGRF